MSQKNPVTPSGIDPGTVRLVAQRLNHYATPGPSHNMLPCKYAPKFSKVSRTCKQDWWTRQVTILTRTWEACILKFLSMRSWQEVPNILTPQFTTKYIATAMKKVCPYMSASYLLIQSSNTTNYVLKLTCGMSYKFIGTTCNMQPSCILHILALKDLMMVKERPKHVVPLYL